MIIIPLNILDAMVVFFRFFSGGLISQMFGGHINDNGTITYSFD
jgi:hypothetical protein